MRKILVAIDGSECAAEAVEYCGMQFSGLEDLSVTLLHVLPNLPPEFWDDGHIPNKREKQAHSRASRRWPENQKQQARQMFLDAIDVLKQKGIRLVYRCRSRGITSLRFPDSAKEPEAHKKR